MLDMNTGLEKAGKVNNKLKYIPKEFFIRNEI
jgi:hypothetical protein